MSNVTKKITVDYKGLYAASQTSNGNVITNNKKDYNEVKAKSRFNRFVNSELMDLYKNHDKNMKLKSSELLKLKNHNEQLINEYLSTKKDGYLFDIVHGGKVDKYLQKLLTIRFKIQGRFELLNVQRKVDKETKLAIHSAFRVASLDFFEGTAFQGFERFIVNQILWSPFHNYRNFILKSSTELMELVNEAVFALLLRSEEFINLKSNPETTQKEVYKFLGRHLRQALDLFVLRSRTQFTIPDSVLKDSKGLLTYLRRESTDSKYIVNDSYAYQAEGLSTKLKKLSINSRLSNTQKTVDYLSKKVYNDLANTQAVTKIESIDGQKNHKRFTINDKGELQLTAKIGDIQAAKRISKIIDNSLTILTCQGKLLAEVDNKILLGSQTGVITVDIPIVKLCKEKYDVVYLKDVKGFTNVKICKLLGLSLNTVKGIYQEQLTNFRKIYDRLLNTKVYNYEFGGLRSRLNGITSREIYVDIHPEIDITIEDFMEMDNPFTNL